MEVKALIFIKLIDISYHNACISTWLWIISQDPHMAYVHKNIIENIEILSHHA